VCWKQNDQRIIEHVSAADLAGCRTTEIMSPWIDACEINQAFLEQGRASTDEDKLSALGGFAGQAGIPALSLGPYGLLELQIPLIANRQWADTKQPDGPNEILERLMHGGVMVDNKYDTGRVRHARVPSTIGKVK
jgi:hypothetical protein